MSGARPDRTVGAMPKALLIRRKRSAASAGAAVACALALCPAAGQAATGHIQTLRFFDKTVSLKLTHADGTVVDRPPFAEPQPGDVLDVNSLEFAGNHRHHAARPTGSAHLRCVFSTAPEPDCESHTALGGSLLVFRGNPGTLINGTGRFQGATGRVVSLKEVEGGSDVVAKIRLAARPRATG
jgi:hypothetical protein